MIARKSGRGKERGSERNATQTRNISRFFAHFDVTSSVIYRYLLVASPPAYLVLVEVEHAQMMKHSERGQLGEVVGVEPKLHEIGCELREHGVAHAAYSACSHFE